jgi:hypothetical protein
MKLALATIALAVSATVAVAQNSSGVQLLQNPPPEQRKTVPLTGVRTGNPNVPNPRANQGIQQNYSPACVRGAPGRGGQPAC